MRPSDGDTTNPKARNTTPREVAAAQGETLRILPVAKRARLRARRQCEQCALRRRHLSGLPRAPHCGPGTSPDRQAPPRSGLVQTLR